MSTKIKIESGMQLLARLIRKQEIGNFYPALFQSSPKNGDIIEISCESGSPLLIDMISDVLLSQLQGKDIGLIHFNTDGNLNYPGLLNVMRKKILFNSRKQDNMATVVNVEKKLYENLHNYHICEINDATQLCTSIYNLENILMEHPNISLIIFDTLTAYYWSEQGYKILKMDSYVKNLLQIIQKVTKEYKVTCVYTRPHYFNSNKDVDHIESWVTDTINYRIQIDKHEKEYKVNVRTNQLEYMKYFQVKNDETIWL